MKHTKIVDIPAVPATTKEVVEYVACDICGTRIKPKEGCNVDEVIVLHRTGNSYPEGGSGEQTSLDICGQCFDKKLVPWLVSQCANVVTEDWEW